jgi:hypothetical protein
MMNLLKTFTRLRTYLDDEFTQNLYPIIVEQL